MAINDIVQTIAEARVDARSLSEFVFKPAGFKVTRRLAPTIDTLQFYVNSLSLAVTEAQGKVEYIETTVQDAINNAVISSGFVTIDSFELGATITQRNQALRHAADGKLYRWAGDLPKTVPVGSTPTSSGGISANAWLEVSDTALRQELTSPAGGFLIGGVPIVIETMADLVNVIRLPNKTYLLKAFYPDFDGVEAIYEWQPSYSKLYHNGGTIIDPNHTSTVAGTGWWESANTGNGCFVMVSADNKHLDVRWFGARNDTDIFAPDFDSWDAFDAAFRTCFWNHAKAKKSVNGIRRVMTPIKDTDSYDGGVYRGYYVSRRITDEAKGFPLASKGVTWTALDVASAEVASGRIVIFDGVQTHFSNNIPCGVMKNPNDYLYRFKWIRTEFYNIAITGNSVIGDQYPPILNNQKTMGDNIFLRACSGFDYATLEGLTVESGLVPYQIYPDVADRVAGTFNIGIIVDNSETGTNADSVSGALVSNINTSTITNINTVYCKGTALFLSRSDTSTADSNGCYFHFLNAQTAKRAAVLTINGGSSNKAYIQCAQTNFAAVHLIGSDAGAPSRNTFEVSYMGDFAEGNAKVAYMFLDNRTTNSNIKGNVLHTTGTNYRSSPLSGMGTWIQIHPLSNNKTTAISFNAVKSFEANGVSGVLSEVTSGFGTYAALPLHTNLTSKFVNGEGELLPSGYYKNTVSLSTLLGGFAVADIPNIFVKIDIYIMNGATFPRKVLGSWVCSANIAESPVFFNVTTPVNIENGLEISDPYILDGEILWDITGIKNSTTKCFAFASRVVT